MGFHKLQSNKPRRAPSRRDRSKQARVAVELHAAGEAEWLHSAVPPESYRSIGAVAALSPFTLLAHCVSGRDRLPTLEAGA